MSRAHVTIVFLAAGMVCAGCSPDRDEIIDGIEFVWCPAGSFQMGHTPGDPASNPSEDPRHEVTFADGFWMSKYEVTREQWEAVMAGVKLPKSLRGKKASFPKTLVSFNDAQDFIAAINALRPGKNYRLPSEAEWEYACRAGTSTRCYWGEDLDWTLIGLYAWHDGNSGNDEHEVGQKLPNAWGLYDMCGNLWEWTQDYWHSTYIGAPADGSAWLDPSDTWRVVRGGSYFNGSGCRSAFRGASGTEARYGDYGLRLVMTPDTKTRF